MNLGRDRLPAPPRHSEDDTQELPPVPIGPGTPRRSRRPLPRAAVAAALTTAAMIGFGGALLLPHDQDARPDSGAAPPPPPAASQPPAASVSAAPDPDGPRTLREGDTGPEVTELQQRLLPVPDVYAPGPTTGRYDAGLTRAVARFQLWYGIRGDETGVHGDDTRLALESRTAAFGN